MHKTMGAAPEPAMFDPADKDQERLPLTRAFVVAFAQAEEARARVVEQAKPAGDSGHSEESDESAPRADARQHADALATQLQVATRKLARDAMAWTGAAGEADIAAAQYAYVALLDELLLFSAWPGASAWETQPLEARIFGTRAAGERVPTAIEALLAQRDPAQRDLANVYLACLTLGFKGRLRGEAGALRHDQLRHALFAFAMQRDPEPERLGARLERTALTPGEVRPLGQMFPDRARLALLVGGGCAVLIAISELLWVYATAPVRPALDRFEAISLTAERPTHVDAATTSGVVLPPNGARGREGTVRPLAPFGGSAPPSPSTGERPAPQTPGTPTVSTTPTEALAQMPSAAVQRVVAVTVGTRDGDDANADTTQTGVRP
jgi:type IV/VI secretion system ImpK/VasF family protein